MKFYLEVTVLIKTIIVFAMWYVDSFITILNSQSEYSLSDDIKPIFTFYNSLEDHHIFNYTELNFKYSRYRHFAVLP